MIDVSLFFRGGAQDPWLGGWPEEKQMGHQNVQIPLCGSQQSQRLKQAKCISSIQHQETSM